MVDRKEIVRIVTSVVQWLEGETPKGKVYPLINISTPTIRYGREPSVIVKAYMYGYV